MSAALEMAQGCYSGMAGSAQGGTRILQDVHLGVQVIVRKNRRRVVGVVARGRGLDLRRVQVVHGGAGLALQHLVLEALVCAGSTGAMSLVLREPALFQRL